MVKNVMSSLVNQAFECDESVAIDNPRAPEMVTGELSLYLQTSALENSFLKSLL